MKQRYKLLVFKVDRETGYKLVEDLGSYTEGSLIKLMWAVFRHRFYHLCNGEGWRD